MIKKASVVLAIAVAGLASLYLSGLRLNVDGTGMWPRFVTQSPDYDALEAHRSQQREHAPPPSPTPESPASPAPVTGETTAPLPGEPAAPVEEPPSHTPDLWPDFRGAERDGRYQGAPIRTTWPPEGLPKLWSQPVGIGYASFVVANGRAFTIEQRRNLEVVAAYDTTTGRELWTNSWEGEFVEALGGPGPRATPTYHDGRIYALGALGELRCLDAGTGRVIWRKNILSENGASNLTWGMSGSPLIVDDTVVVLPGGSRGRSVVAYSKSTGTLVWSALDDQQSYTSPMLATVGGVRQILVVSAARAVGLATGSGRLLWEYPWSNSTAINVAQPLVLPNNRVFLSASYGGGTAVIELSPDGDRFIARSVWTNQRMKNKFTSSVLHNGFIYGLDESILACVNPETGDQCWKGGRYGYGQVLLAGDHLIVLTEDGAAVLVKATPERHEELARFQAIEGKTWNHPVIADGRLLVRNTREMAAFDIRGQ